MKNLYLLFLIVFVQNVVAQEKKILASCCSGRCTGSSYCNVCSNCSRCAHCTSGGTCGVCASPAKYKEERSTKKRSSRTRNSTTYSSDSPSSAELFQLDDDIQSDNYKKISTVKAKGINVRSGPGTEYTALEALNEGDEVLYLAEINGWYKVQVINSGGVGYVSKRYVKGF